MQEEQLSFRAFLNLLSNKSYLKKSLFFSITIFALVLITAYISKISFFSSKQIISTPWYDQRDIRSATHMFKKTVRRLSPENVYYTFPSILALPDLISASKTGILRFKTMGFAESNIKEQEINKLTKDSIEQIYIQLFIYNLKNYYGNRDYYDNYITGKTINANQFYNKIEALDRITVNGSLIQTFLNEIVRTQSTSIKMIKERSLKATNKQKALFFKAISENIPKTRDVFIPTEKSYYIFHHSFKFLLSLFLSLFSFGAMYFCYFIKELVVSE